MVRVSTAEQDINMLSCRIRDNEMRGTMEMLLSSPVYSESNHILVCVLPSLIIKASAIIKA